MVETFLRYLPCQCVQVRCENHFIMPGDIIETKIIGQNEDDIRWVWLLSKSTGA